MFTSFWFVVAMFACYNAWCDPLPLIESLNSKGSRWEFVTVSRDGYSLYRRPNRGSNVFAVFTPDGHLRYLNTLYPDGKGISILGSPRGSVLRTPDVAPLAERYEAYVEERRKRAIEERYAKGDAQYEKEERERRRTDGYIIGWERLPEFGGGIVGSFEYHGEQVILLPGGDCYVRPVEASVKEVTGTRGEFSTPWEDGGCFEHLSGKVSSSSGSLVNRVKDGENNLADKERRDFESEPAPLPKESSVNRVSSRDVARQLPNERLNQKGSSSSIRYSENNLADKERRDFSVVDVGLLLDIEGLKERFRRIQEVFFSLE